MFHLKTDIMKPKERDGHRMVQKKKKERQKQYAERSRETDISRNRGNGY